MTRLVVASLAASLTLAPVLGLRGGLALPPASVAQGSDSTAMYTVGGVRVIHRRARVATVVTNLYLLGGVRNTPARIAGLEALLLEASGRGTAKYSRDALRRALARTGSEMVVEPREDWTMIGARAIPAALDSTWSILADRVMRPRLDSAEVEFVRAQMLTGVAQRDDSPDAVLEYAVDSVAFAGAAYAQSPVGTPRTISAITRADLLRFQREQMVTSRMLLVVVGDVDRPTVERLVTTTLGTLPAGTYTWTMPDTLASPVPDAAIIARALPTNYIQGEFRGPPANSADATALRVASAVLSGRLFGEIRSKRNLTYAVSANYRDRALTSVGLYVTTTEPDSVLSIMLGELRTLQVVEVRTEALRPIVQQFITEYFLSHETSTAQADFLARAHLYRGDFRAGSRFVAELRSVTGADVRRVSQRYFRNARWAYVGDPSQVTKQRMLNF
ncbi:MAG: insulinase family protein [Gemmatimonadetes bacterium]|nr:insulinase family protein [Gemmatimonadota bacterium]